MARSTLVARMDQHDWSLAMGLLIGIPVAIIVIALAICCVPCCTGDRTWPPHNRYYYPRSNGARTADTNAGADANRAGREASTV